MPYYYTVSSIYCNRHPITVTMTRDCCNTRTYNPFVQECCSDGNVEADGTC